MSPIKEEVDEFVERIRNAAGQNLESVVLYGSAARDDFSEQYSDLNLLCVVRDAGVRALEQVAAVVGWWSRERGHRPPLVLTAEELRTSASVFAIETLDIKAEHRILAGGDLLAEIEVPMNLHRVQVEHELRAMLLKLRQHLLLFSGQEQELQQAAAKSVSSIVVLLRHAMIALGHAPAAGSKRQVLLQAGEVLGIDPAGLVAALDLREGRRTDYGTEQLYDRYMQAIAGIVQRIESVIPKREWQRTTG
jgi:predicted nucleotidyltransferase